MPGAELDMSELNRWIDVLQAAPTVARREARKMVSKASLNVKTSAQRRAPRGPHTPHYASSITYDIDEDGNEIVGEIGPVEGRRQRGLGNLLEYGSAHNDPHPHLEPALDEEEPRFYRFAEQLAGMPFEG